MKQRWGRILSILVKNHGSTGNEEPNSPYPMATATSASWVVTKEKEDYRRIIGISCTYGFCNGGFFTDFAVGVFTDFATGYFYGFLTDFFYGFCSGFILMGFWLVVFYEGKADRPATRSILPYFLWIQFRMTRNASQFSSAGGAVLPT